MRFDPRPDIDGFVGRADETRRLVAALEDDRICVIALTGRPGIGRRWLASRAVQELTRPRTIVWVRVMEWNGRRAINAVP